MEILDIDNESPITIEDNNSESLFFIETEGENKSCTEINMAQGIFMSCICIVYINMCITYIIINSNLNNKTFFYRHIYGNKK